MGTPFNGHHSTFSCSWLIDHTLRNSGGDDSAVCNIHRISKHSMLCISYTFIASVYICRERLYTICLYCVYGFHMCLIYNRTTELYTFLVKSNKYGV